MGCFGAGLLSQASFGAQVGEDLYCFWSKHHLGISDAHPRPVLMLLVCDAFAFWLAVRALAGLETSEMANAFWWGIYLGFLGS